MQHGDPPYIELDYENARWLLHYMGDPPNGREQITPLEADFDDEDSAVDEAASLADCAPEDIEVRYD